MPVGWTHRGLYLQIGTAYAGHVATPVSGMDAGVLRNVGSEMRVKIRKAKVTL